MGLFSLNNNSMKSMKRLTREVRDADDGCFFALVQEVASLSGVFFLLRIKADSEFRYMHSESAVPSRYGHDGS